MILSKFPIVARKVLTQESIVGMENGHQALFIFAVAQIVGLMEMEATILQNIRGVLKEEEFSLLG